MGSQNAVAQMLVSAMRTGRVPNGPHQSIRCTRPRRRRFAEGQALRVRMCHDAGTYRLDHVVALFGITPWVRDVRRGRPTALARRGRLTPVRLEELSPAANSEFLTWFRSANPGPARQYLTGVASRPDEALALAERHPVFRVVNSAA